MQRTITVKGSGSVSISPDLIVLSLKLRTFRKNYSNAIEAATKEIDLISSAIIEAGLKKKDLKTTSFDVETEYERYQDQEGNYKRVFSGYACHHNLKLKIDFDNKLFSKVLNEISNTSVKPEIEVNFSIKDERAVKEELLVKATQNASERATILTKASGVELGSLLSIDYNWGELHLYSSTDYVYSERMMSLSSESRSFDIEPDDIKVSDTVTFVWEIN